MHDAQMVTTTAPSPSQQKYQLPSDEQLQSTADTVKRSPTVDSEVSGLSLYRDSPANAAQHQYYFSPQGEVSIPVVKVDFSETIAGNVNPISRTPIISVDLSNGTAAGATSVTTKTNDDEQLLQVQEQMNYLQKLMEKLLQDKTNSEKNDNTSSTHSARSRTSVAKPSTIMTNNASHDSAGVVAALPVVRVHSYRRGQQPAELLKSRTEKQSELSFSEFASPSPHRLYEKYAARSSGTEYNFQQPSSQQSDLERNALSDPLLPGRSQRYRPYEEEITMHYESPLSRNTTDEPHRRGYDDVDIPDSNYVVVSSASSQSDPTDPLQAIRRLRDHLRVLDETLEKPSESTSHDNQFASSVPERVSYTNETSNITASQSVTPILPEWYQRGMDALTGASNAKRANGPAALSISVPEISDQLDGRTTDTSFPPTKNSSGGMLASIGRPEDVSNALKSFLSVIQSCEQTAAAARELVVDLDRKMGSIQQPSSKVTTAVARSSQRSGSGNSDQSDYVPFDGHARLQRVASPSSLRSSSMPLSRGIDLSKPQRKPPVPRFASPSKKNEISHGSGFITYGGSDQWLSSTLSPREAASRTDVSQTNSSGRSLSRERSSHTLRSQSRSPTRLVRPQVAKEPLSTRPQSPSFKFSQNPASRSCLIDSSDTGRGIGKKLFVASDTFSFT